MDFIERAIKKSLEEKSEAEDELMGEQKEEKKAERLKEPMGGKILVCEKVFGGFNIGDTIKTRSNNKGFSIKLFNSQEGRLVKGENWITVDVGDDFEDFSNSFIFREEEKSESVLDEEVVKEKLKEEISDKTVGGENQPELKKETMGQEEFAEEELTPEIEIEDEEKKEQAELEPELKKEMPEQKEVVEEKGREELEQKLLQVDKLLSLYKDRGRFLFHLKNLKESDANENEIAVAQTKVSEINYNIKGLYNKITESDIKGFPENEKRKIEEIMLAVEEGKMDYGKLAVRENEEKESRVLLEINKNLDRIKREVQNLDYRNDENRKMTENFIKELEEYKELTEVTLKIEGLGIVESANCVQLTKSITETIDEIKNKLEIEPEPETPETPEIKTEEEKRHEAEDLAYKKTAKESSDKMRHRVTRIGEKIADNQEMSSENREKIEKERSMETISSIMFDLNRDSYEEDPEKRRKLFEAAASAMKIALFEQKTICKRKESELAEARKEAVEKFGIASEGGIVRVVSKKDSQKTKESKKGGFWSGIKERMGIGNKEKTEEEKSENSELKKAVAVKILEIKEIENKDQLSGLFLFKDKKGKEEKIEKIGVMKDYMEKIIENLSDELKEKGGIEKIIKELEFDREYFEGVMGEEGKPDSDEEVVNIMGDPLSRGIDEPVKEIPEIEIAETEEMSEKVKKETKEVMEENESEKKIRESLEPLLSFDSEIHSDYPQVDTEEGRNIFLNSDIGGEKMAEYATNYETLRNNIIKTIKSGDAKIVSSSLSDLEKGDMLAISTNSIDNTTKEIYIFNGEKEMPNTKENAFYFYRLGQGNEFVPLGVTKENFRVGKVEFIEKNDKKETGETTEVTEDPKEQTARDIEHATKCLAECKIEMGPKKVKEYDERIRATIKEKPIKEGDTIENLKEAFSQSALGQEWSPDFKFKDFEKRYEIAKLLRKELGNKEIKMLERMVFVLQDQDYKIVNLYEKIKDNESINQKIKNFFESVKNKKDIKNLTVKDLGDMLGVEKKSVF